MFGGQKGLPADDAEALNRCDSWMVGYGRLLDAAIAGARAQGLLRTSEGARTFGSVLGVPGAGAAGGLGAALLALGAELRSGVETVLDLIGFDERVRDVDLVITGEGNMDEQSAAGKAPVGVARRAKRYGKPVVAVVGGRADSWMRCMGRASIGASDLSQAHGPGAGTRSARSRNQPHLRRRVCRASLRPRPHLEK